MISVQIAINWHNFFCILYNYIINLVNILIMMNFETCYAENDLNASQVEENNEKTDYNITTSIYATSSTIGNHNETIEDDDAGCFIFPKRSSLITFINFNKIKGNM